MIGPVAWARGTHNECRAEAFTVLRRCAVSWLWKVVMEEGRCRCWNGPLRGLRAGGSSGSDQRADRRRRFSQSGPAFGPCSRKLAGHRGNGARVQALQAVGAFGRAFAEAGAGKRAKGWRGSSCSAEGAEGRTLPGRQATARSVRWERTRGQSWGMALEGCVDVGTRERNCEADGGQSQLGICRRAGCPMSGNRSQCCTPAAKGDSYSRWLSGSVVVWVRRLLKGDETVSVWLSSAGRNETTWKAI